MRFKGLRVPQLANQLPEPLWKYGDLVTGRSLDVHIVLLAQKVVSERTNTGESLNYMNKTAENAIYVTHMQDHVRIVVCLDVVEPNDARIVGGPVECS